MQRKGGYFSVTSQTLRLPDGKQGLGPLSILVLFSPPLNIFSIVMLVKMLDRCLACGGEALKGSRAAVSAVSDISLFLKSYPARRLEEVADFGFYYWSKANGREVKQAVLPKPVGSTAKLLPPT